MELISLSNGYIVTCLSSLVYWLNAKKEGRQQMNNIRVRHVHITTVHMLQIIIFIVVIIIFLFQYIHYYSLIFM
jgi:hypothetical protein